MRRTVVLLLSAALLLVTLLVGGGALASQDAAPADYSDHPLVGTWMIDSDPEDPDNWLSLSTFTSDGTVLDSAPDGLPTAHGLWEPTGENTAVMKFIVLEGEDGSVLVIRGTIEMAADGQSFTSPYTLEFIDGDGESSGEIGPGMAEGTRMALEEPGTPVASFEEFFEAPPATPGATPAG